MQIAKYDGTRLIRFALWTLAMLAAFVVVEIYAPHKTVLVPCLGILFFVPAVLLPLRPKKNE
jgi:hypothetical protein